MADIIHTLAAGDSMQPPSYTQKRTVKRILIIRCGNHGCSASFHAFKLCSHVRFGLLVPRVSERCPHRTTRLFVFNFRLLTSVVVTLNTYSTPQFNAIVRAFRPSLHRLQPGRYIAYGSSSRYAERLISKYFI